MIEKTLTDEFGRRVKLLTPENEKDMKEIQKRSNDGELDSTESFADAPKRLPLEDQDDGEI